MDFVLPRMGQNDVMQCMSEFGEADDLATYNSGTRRFDWILISKQLEFVSFEVLPDILSDHAAVMAEIGIKSSGETADTQ